MNERALSISKATLSPVPPYAFEHIEDIIVNIQDKETKIEAGKICCPNPAIQFGPSIRIQDWIFCIERNALVQDIDWLIGGFNEDTHYVFYELEPERDIHVALVAFAVSMVFPILIPDAFSSVKKPIKNNMVNFTYKWIPLE